MPKWLNLILLLSLLPAAAFPLEPTPLPVKAKGGYTFPKGVYAFEDNLFEGYVRGPVTAFDQDMSYNIAVAYYKRDEGKLTLFSLNIYAAGLPMENRLRLNFLDPLAFSIRNDQATDISLSPLGATNGTYTCNGYRATYLTGEGNLSSLSFFECGHWFYSLRVISDSLDRPGMDALSERIIAAYNPADLTAASPAGSQTVIGLDDQFAGDSVRMQCEVTAARGRAVWALENVSAGERASGVPDIYLDMYAAGFVSIALAADSLQVHAAPETKRYIEDVCAIIGSGFLREFLIGQLYDVAKLPPGFTPDMEGFLKWKEGRDLIVDLTPRLSRITYISKD